MHIEKELGSQCECVLSLRPQRQKLVKDFVLVFCLDHVASVEVFWRHDAVQISQTAVSMDTIEEAYYVKGTC